MNDLFHSSIRTRSLLDSHAIPLPKGVESHARRILLIDDNVDNLYILKRMLISAGYWVVETVQDSRTAMEVFRQFEPQVVFLDLRMPHVDGFEILQSIRELGSPLCETPIIITSSDNSVESKMRALEVGATEFCSDIYVLNEIVPLVKRIIGHPTQ